MSKSKFRPRNLFALIYDSAFLTYSIYFLVHYMNSGASISSALFAFFVTFWALILWRDIRKPYSYDTFRELNRELNNSRRVRAQARYETAKKARTTLKKKYGKA